MPTFERMRTVEILFSGVLEGFAKEIFGGGMKHLGDITKIDWSQVEPVDVVTADQIAMEGV